MKTLITKYLITALFTLIFTSSFCQDFTVKVASTENNNNFILPLKQGTSTTLDVTVTNNRKDTCTVSYVSHWYIPDSWVKCGNNGLTLKPKQSGNYKLTITIPSGDAYSGTYTLNLDFEATMKNGSKMAFSGNMQTLFVDNTAPIAPTYTVTKSSYNITISSFHSSDAGCGTYTTFNAGTGINGIKEYTISISKGGNTVKSETKKATDIDYYKISNLTANTTYKISVTATDLAGNTSKATEKNVLTAPAPPTIKASDITCMDAKLSWNKVNGAIGYYIYSNGKLLNSTPTSSTTYILKGLKENTSYKCYAIAINSEKAESDHSKEIEIKTVSSPKIKGGERVCKTGSWTYSLDYVPTGFTVTWGCSSKLTKTSSSNDKATYKANSNGNAAIKATIKSPYGETLELTDLNVYAGVPTAPTSINGLYSNMKYSAGSQYNFGVTNSTMAKNYNWIVTGATIYGSNSNSVISVTMPTMRSGEYDRMFTIKVCRKNECGTSPYYSANGTIRAGLPLRMVNDSTMEYDSITTVTHSLDNAISTYINNNNENKHIKLYPNPTNGILHLIAHDGHINSLEIININGITVKKTNYTESDSNISIDVSDLANGLYILNINNNQDQLSFIKE